MMKLQVSYGLAKENLTDSEIGSSTFYVQVNHQNSSQLLLELLPSSSPLCMTLSLN